jgi:hypothetical protein
MSRSQIDLSRELQVEIILDKLGLVPDHLPYVQSVNPSRSLPYHGYQHLLTVAIACYSSGEYYFGKNIKQIRPLFLAGLYHDWDHSGNKYADSINVARAIVGMTKALEELENLDNLTISEIANLIAITEFPIRRFPITQAEKIILDADKMQWVETDFKRWSTGLGQELNLDISWESTKKFFKKEPLCTSWARSRLFEKGLVEAIW